MRFMPSIRPAALALLLTTQLVSTVAHAQMQTVTIRAYDAKGKDTGKCIRGLNGLSDGPGGYRLADCDKKAANQKFRFDVNTGGYIAQIFGETAYSDGLGVYMGILMGNGDAAWFPGAQVNRVNGADPAFSSASSKWRWVGKQISNLDTGSGTWCLTTMPGKGPDIRIDRCSETSTLTQWDVKLAK